MTRVVVAGWGQLLRGDDASGRLVADKIDERWGDRVTVLSGVQPLPEWAPTVAAADYVFFVDANGYLSADTLQVVAPDQRVDVAPSSDGHGLGSTSLLQLARSLYGGSPIVQLLLIPSEQFDVGIILSPRAARGVSEAVDWIDRALNQLEAGLVKGEVQ